MRLSTLIGGLGNAECAGDLSAEIEGVTADSREVKKGFLFAALRGELSDGHKFIDEACSKGASAILLDDPAYLPVSGAAVSIVVPDSKVALGVLASRFYGEPSGKLKLAGITGTNGKTTTAYILEAIMDAGGFVPGVIGTVNYRFGGRVIEAANTTPDPVKLQGLLADMVREGVTHCVMEVSSHALAQRRVEGCSFDTVIFTNLTQDHLDYHGSMDEYGRAKELLFLETADDEKMSVINIDDPFGKALAAKAKHLISYGLAEGDICLLESGGGADGFDLKFSTPEGDMELKTSLVGRHNLYNIMAAIGAAISLGIEKRAIVEGISSLTGIPGRLERVVLPGAYANVRVFVDYAHTPDALERVIKALRPTTKGRLLTIFGCGGDRDREKRALMGGISAGLSDLSIITSDNPRSEEPLSIILEIEKGAMAGGGKKGENYLVVADRRDAIAQGVRMLKDGDTLLVAGKGHEDYQILGDRVIDFDDRIECRKAFDLVASERKVA